MSALLPRLCVALLLLLLLLLPSCHCSTMAPPSPKPTFSLSSSWQVLGPFQIGTRGQ
jgi:hypothetical protein